MLSKDDCLVMRGLAIMSIFVHNYCHMLLGAVHENEFWFSEENNREFWMKVFGSDVVVQVFSYLGHLGVPVFVFLTGYGLSVKYGKCANDNDVGTFVWNHYRKFLTPMFWGMVAFIAVYLVLNGSLWNGWLQTFVAQMTMTCNLVFHPDRLIKPGPYWYFGMTMQLYLIFRLVVCRCNQRFFLLVVTLSVVMLVFLETHRYSLIWYKYNAVGWLLPFAIGIWAPRLIHCLPMHRRWWLMVMVAAGASVLLFGGNYWLWVFVPVMSLVFFVGASKCIGRGVVYKVAKFLGRISLYIFVVHPIVREIVRHYVDNNYRYVGLMVYVILVVGCSWCLLKLKQYFTVQTADS